MDHNSLKLLNLTKAQMTLLVIILVVAVTKGYLCSVGCTSNCTSDYTCQACNFAYDDDHSCLQCALIAIDSTSSTTYVRSNNTCLVSNKKIVRDMKTSIPPDEFITEVFINQDLTIDLNEQSDVDVSFCTYNYKNRFGKWLKLDNSKLTQPYLYVNITKLINTSSTVYFDITNTPKTSQNKAKCFTHTYLDDNTTSFSLFLPSAISKVDDPFYYMFVHINEAERVRVNINIVEQEIKAADYEYHISQEIADNLVKNIDQVLLWVPFEARGVVTNPVCYPHVAMKSVVFTMEFIGDYKMLMDATINNRMNYIQEYTIVDPVTKQLKCEKTWNGWKFGALAEQEKAGVIASVDGNVTGLRRFTIMSVSQQDHFVVKFKAICPHKCNADKGWGNCSTYEEKCICKDEYGGDDCHLKCFFNDKWNEDSTNKCYFGANHCDQYCQCEAGYENIDHFCISQKCLSNVMDTNVSCWANSEGCKVDCTCMERAGYSIGYNHTCKNKLCGNGIQDKYYDNEGKYLRTEETLSNGEIVGLVIGCVCAFLIAVVIIGIIIFLVAKTKKIDINIYKTQQPNYYFYINGSLRSAPSKKAKHSIDPIELGFGNEQKATEIFDTRFEKVEVKNHSRNKWMMVIFHTPNNPKFVFHFEPQVLFLRPSVTKVITVYMTLHCTTFLKRTKLPYTVWFSKSKSTLQYIADTLKNKTFESFTQDDKIFMDKLCKNVQLRIHNAFTIITDATSSTHIDMDELNMSESPIAEGAMGKVYIGNYRSVPVAIKQFRWESLSDEEMKELKKDVMSECEMMSKLRNPFIANYMGSVTYMPQVSMVIQFFVLGSLGEYLTKDKQDYLPLSYKLKVRMLFDTARGMQFLHENRIMHLDLKPDNLLVNSLDPNSACTLKITDFGTSRFVKKSIIKGEDKGLGTPVYAAPESFRDEYTYSGDVYSYGITAWEIFYQREPYFELKSVFEIRQHVLNGKRLEIDRTMPRLYNELVEDCWKQDPGSRPTFDQVTKKIVKIDDDVINQTGLDVGVSTEKVEELVNKRTRRLQEQLVQVERD
ncbi:serine-threonine protein kinase, putative [Entamoeba invadens IP1]|uniref:serine-threonine protein kinase, putative n=1 Tax=Entamoeba invadens IP1 TaxID=370355 RepID=UPI0002C3F6D4|nr:serine-threonine protein kinase, putative [Entamoeba invadens IP1]ELP90629.1 serine-threonine protein kinase, putative [Entamoeba invadens IP1]|eukprot:XP_004257400.1 serine-threonine protein kinase, putative [Entamoeba invadens IP1]